MFSIIIPVYNGQQTIIRAINSCLNQSVYDLEVIIIDNCSTDETKKYVKQIKDTRIKYIYVDKKGRSNARNIGIKNSTGKYLLFLDADDELDRFYLSKALNILRNNLDYFGYSCGTIYHNSIINTKTLLKCEKDWQRKLRVQNVFPINSIVIRNSEIHKFNTSFEYNEDWLFWYDNLKSKKLYSDEDYFGAIVNIHGKNTMNNTNIMTDNEMLVRLKIRNQLKFIEKILYSPLYIKFIYIYFNILDINELVKKKLLKEMPLEYLIVIFCMKMPFLNKFLYNKLKYAKSKNPFLYS